MVTQISTVDVIGIKYNLRCRQCGRVWGVYLENLKTLPKGYDICLNCTSNFLNTIVKEDVNNEAVKFIAPVSD